MRGTIAYAGASLLFAAGFGSALVLYLTDYDPGHGNHNAFLVLTVLTGLFALFFLGLSRMEDLPDNLDRRENELRAKFDKELRDVERRRKALR